VTYDELDGSTQLIAAGLAGRGIGRGDRVGLAVRRGRPAVEGILGILKTGASYVPLDPSYPMERLDFIASDADLSLVLIDDSAVNVGLGVPCSTIDEVVAAGRTAPSAPVELSSDLPAYVIYTSGSTGRPKGVVVTHRNVMALLRGALPLFDFTSADRWTLFHSYSFDFSVWEMWGAIATGGAAVVVEPDTAASPAAFARLLAAEKVTVLNQVPSVFAHVVNAHLADPRTPLELRYVIFGGEALQRPPIRLLRSAEPGAEVRWINMYGITETTVHVTFKELTAADIDTDGPTPIGRPLPHLGIEIYDENRRPCRYDDPGELWIHGDGVAAGYLNQPELTAERFVTLLIGGEGRRCYRSGDLVRRRKDGELEYLGRGDDQVKIRGFRIELGEIEAALLNHAAIEQACVTKLERPTGAILAALVVTRDGQSIDAGDVRTFLSTRLPVHMLPNTIAAVPEIPLAASGKVDRQAVLALASST
jgi:amino acid adenylation domain-containing protein